jgi:hypothetical protein
MSKDTVLMKIGGVPVHWNAEEGKIWYTGEFTIDADGCPRAYGPEGCKPQPLDYLGNAGYPGNWWGIVTDGDGEPFVQGKGDEEKWPYPGLYVSTTAYLNKGFDKYDCRRYVNSEKVAFAVIPGSVRTAVEPKFMGCACRVTDKKSQVVMSGVACCDVGPSNHLGEGSMWLAEQFGLSPSPKSGGSSDKKRFLWEFWPGSESADYPLQ